MTPPIDLYYAYVDPYLPSSITVPLSKILALSQSYLTDPTQLIPLLISLLTLYAAVMSIWSTTRMVIRTVWFLVRWGAVLVAVGAVYQGFGRDGTGNGGWRESVDTVGKVGRTAWGLGKQGVDWWAQSSSSSPTSRNGRGRGAGKGKTPKSASGARRTWSQPTQDGGWDDPEEIDLADTTNVVQDVLRKLSDGVLTFLAPDTTSTTTSTSKRGVKKGKKKQEGEKDDLGGLAYRYLVGRARRAWDDLNEQRPEARGAGGRR
ncbi:hypothetical protein T439DRAFT_325560 [Meredithblackwellia eburnea MCA 4105]